MDFNIKNIPSFILHTFHLIYLAQDSSNFSFFCPPQYLYTFLMDADIENIPCLILHT